MLLILVNVPRTHIYAEQKNLSITSFSQIDLVSGTQNYTIKTSDGQEWKARISVPEKIDPSSEKKFPLVIGLHWLAVDRNDQANSYFRFSKCLLEPVFKDLNAFIIAPQADEILWHTENNQIRVLTMIEEAKEHWPIDSEKVIVTGYSQGGVGSWYYAEKYPEIFSAAIPIASSYPEIPESKISVPLFVIHSTQDETFPYMRIKKRVKEYRSKGTDITFIKDRKLSHLSACAYARHLRKSIDWLEHSVWETETELSGDQ